MTYTHTHTHTHTHTQLHIMHLPNTKNTERTWRRAIIQDLGLRQFGFGFKAIWRLEGMSRK